jgi:hypothetical protein
MAANLEEILNRNIPPESGEWLGALLSRLRQIEGTERRTTLLNAYAAATRRLGKERLGAEETGTERFPAWSRDDAGRALMLLAVAATADDRTFGGLALDCYHNGDAREQSSWLRALPLLPGPERFLDTATDACRTNIIPLFESICCENAYPARFFPELNFNQMVLKALFNVIPLVRIAGLAGRINPELSRMTDDYASEREAAGRALPTDIWLALVPHADQPGLERAKRYLKSEDSGHRHWAALALEQRNARIEGTPS